MRPVVITALLISATALSSIRADEWPPAIEPLFRTVDLNVGESQTVTLSDGSQAVVKLLDLCESRDDLRQAVRKARVTVEVNGQKTTLTTGNYNLPAALGDVQIDCAVTKGYTQSTGSKRRNRWALQKDARLRLWPAGSPWIRPGTFVYPLKQRWFADCTQMPSEPVYVDGVERPSFKTIYYHSGLDFGGSEGLVEVLSPVDALVITSGMQSISMPDIPPSVEPCYDCVYLRDGRGWYYLYAHLLLIDPAIKVGSRVTMGQKVGVLGKEGLSGGWSHLHLGIEAPQPNGEYGEIDGYAFIWQAYRAASPLQLQAVARPHHIAWIGDEIQLDGSRSWSAKGPQHIADYQWILSDGSTADGPIVTCRYDRLGEYSEILKVTDADGKVSYDFTVVQIFDRKHPELLPPAIHATYWPTLDLKPNEEITFKVRSFNIGPTEGCERWDFGDGSPPLEVQSDGTIHPLAKDGYAITTHRYAKPGDYLVSVSRTNNRGQTAIARLYVRIE